MSTTHISASPDPGIVWTNQHTIEQIEQPKDAPSSNWNKPEGPQSSKRLITRACREVLLNPNASPKEKLQAAGVLERIVRLKELALASKRKTKREKRGKSTTKVQISDILSQVAS